MNKIFELLMSAFYFSADNTGGNPDTSDTENKPEDNPDADQKPQDEGSQPFKTFETEDEFNRAIKSARSSAKNEVLKELGITSIADAKETLTNAALVADELETVKTEKQNLTYNLSLAKAGVADEFMNEALTLAKAGVNDKTDFETSLASVLGKFPNMTSVKKGFIAGTDRQEKQDEQKQVDAKLSSKYNWL